MELVRTLARAALAAGLVAATAMAHAATLTRYTAIDLGQGTEATGLNASGQVAGNVIVDGMDRAFVTGIRGAGLTLLDTLGGPMSRATAINDSGQVVGYSWLNGDLQHGGYHAFVTGAGGLGITDLGTLGGISGVCGVCSQATGINNAGVVVGQSADTGHNQRIFVAGPGQYTALRAIGSGSDWTYAGPINNQGLIAGSLNQGGDYQAILVQADGSGMVPLADATDLRQPAVMGINDDGRVVGDFFFAGFRRDAFVTDAGGANLRALLNFGTYGSTAYDINASGWVVGLAYPDTGIGRRAFIAAADGSAQADLNSLVSLPGGNVLNLATAINDQGWIVANSDLGRAYLLVPVPEPATWALWLAGLALPALRRLRRR